MINLDLLQDSLKNASQSNAKEKNTSDDYFDKIVSLIEKEKINEAAKMIETIFAKSTPDIRLIVYYYYAYFTHQGVKAFLEVFPGLVAILNNHWDVLRPFNRKEKQVENSLNWFFSQVLSKLKYCEKLFKEGKMHPIWKSTTEISSDEMNRLMISVEEFKNFFFEKWPKSASKDRLLHLEKKIKEIKPLVDEEPVEEEQEEPEEELAPVVVEVDEIAAKKEEIVVKDEEKEAREEIYAPMVTEEFPSEEHPLHEKVHSEEPEINDAESQTTTESINIQVPAEEPKEPANKITSSMFSPDELEAFSSKLKVFESLIAKNDYLKAAIVAKDIENLITNFDPLSYFPKLFSTYYFLFAKHVAALSEQFNNKESLQVKCLEKLYRIDPDKFLEW